MVRNDYRRSLIMLRAHEPGYSGHVRLESRTLMGSMYFVVNVPAGSGALCAALIRRDARGNYFSTRIGNLRSDGRGQATLAYTFDPRNIDGVPLEDYLLITVVLRRPDGCALALSGNVNGSREVDWDSVTASACDVCQDTLPDCSLCPPAGPGIVIPVVPPVNRPASPGEGPLGSQTPVVPPVNQPASPGEGPAGTQTPSVDSPASPGEGPAGTQTPSVDSPAAPGEGPLGGQTPEVFSSTEPAAWAASGTLKEQSALAALGLDENAPWPGVSEPLRMLFAGQPVRELMLGDGHTYVRAPMPASSGYDYVNIGVRTEGGEPVSVSYALPARYTPEPPPGMEDYVWQGGASEGWWTLLTDARTGAPLTEKAIQRE